MIDSVMVQRVKLLVAEVHSRGEVVQVYNLAQKLPDGQYNANELADLIAKEAVRLKANVCWDRRVFEKQNPAAGA